MDSDERWRWMLRGGSMFARGVLFLTLPACLAGPWPEPVANPFRDSKSGKLVQQGSVAVRDGEEAEVTYRVPFQTPPRLVIDGFVQSYFKDDPYRKDHFEIIQQGATGFKVRNNHGEQNRNSWAEIKWHAEGIRGEKKPPVTREEHLIAAVEKLGGHVTRDIKVYGGPITEIDLHQTKVRDEDLELLEGLTSLHKLNLFGTRITDAGLLHLRGLTGLQVLRLNSTAITDAGLAHLQTLKDLKELSLYDTRVTDDGVAQLTPLKNLQVLTLSGPRITDRALAHLRSFKDLRQVMLSGTRISEAGIEALRRDFPKLQIIR